MKPELIEELARVIEAALCADAGRNQGAIWRSERGRAQMFVSATAIAPIIDRLTAEARAKALDYAAEALEDDAQKCDCFAREERECACGAWDDYKTVPTSRAVEIVRNLKGTDNG